MSTKPHSHDTRLHQLVTRTSTVEDTFVSQEKRAKRIEIELLRVAAKNENLEGQSLRNIVRIIGVAETTETGAMALLWKTF